MAVVLGRKAGGSGGGGAPSGPAGGSLGGTYPNPTIANLAVDTAQIAAGAVTAAKVAADVATQAELDAVQNAAVLKALYDANTVLAADTNDTPAALTMGASTILARLAAGNIKAATPSEIRTLLGVQGIIDTVTVTSPVTVTGTNEAGATTIITGTTLTYAATPVRIEFSTPQIACGAGGTIQIYLYLDGATIGLIGVNTTTLSIAGNIVTYHTPSAGSHTYSIRAARTVADGTIQAGAGTGSGQYRPMFLVQSQ